MSPLNEGLYTSTSAEWATPIELFTALDAEFGFDLDVCADASNAKCARYFTREVDGLAQRWQGTVWMNPPYGRQIGAWVEKAFWAAHAGATVVCLLPARTDTAYWHDFVMRAAEIRFIRGRLHFIGEYLDALIEAGEAAGHNAPFPSVVAVFRPGVAGPPICSQIDRAARPLSAAFDQAILDFGGGA